MRYPNYNPKLTPAENRRLAEDYVRQSGTDVRPQAPRSLQAQPGSRGFMVSWSLPAVFEDITGWRVYADTENNLIGEISDRGNRQYFVESTGGDAPVKRAAFVSAINLQGRESRKVQVISNAQREMGVTAPTAPTAPPDYPSTGGRDRTVARGARYGLNEL